MSTSTTLVTVVKNVTWTEKSSGVPSGADLADTLPPKWSWPPSLRDSITQLPTLKKLTIVSYEFKTTPDKQATFYTIECENSNDEKYTIVRRFARLKLLYEWIIAELPHIKIPQLPKKIFTFWKGKSDEATARRTALQSILNFIILDPTLKFLAPIQAFFSNIPTDTPPAQGDAQQAGILYLNVCETRGWNTASPIRYIRCYPCLQFTANQSSPHLTLEGAIDRRGEFSFYQEVCQYTSWRQDSSLVLNCVAGTNSSQFFATSLPLACLEPYQLYDLWLSIHGVTKTGTQRGLRCLVQFTPLAPPRVPLCVRLPALRIHLFKDGVLLGETLRGYAVLNIIQPTPAKGVKVELQCDLVTNTATVVTKPSSSTDSGYNGSFVSNKKETIHKGYRYFEVGNDTGSTTLPPGTHVFPFEFWIPPDAEASSMLYTRDRLSDLEGALYWSLKYENLCLPAFPTYENRFTYCFGHNSVSIDVPNGKSMRVQPARTPIRVIDRLYHKHQVYLDRVIDVAQRYLLSEASKDQEYITRVDEATGARAELQQMSSMIARASDTLEIVLRLSNCKVESARIKLVAQRRKFKPTASEGERIKDFVYSTRKKAYFDSENDKARESSKREQRENNKKDAPFLALVPDPSETVEEKILEEIDAKVEHHKHSLHRLDASFDLSTLAYASAPRRPRASPNAETRFNILVSTETDNGAQVSFRFPIFIATKDDLSCRETQWLYPPPPHTPGKSLEDDELLQLLGLGTPHWPESFWQNRFSPRTNFAPYKTTDGDTLENDAFLTPASIFAPQRAHPSFPCSITNLLLAPQAGEQLSNLRCESKQHFMNVKDLLEALRPTKSKLGAYTSARVATDDAELAKIETKPAVRSAKGASQYGSLRKSKNNKTKVQRTVAAAGVGSSSSIASSSAATTAATTDSQSSEM